MFQRIARTGMYQDRRGRPLGRMGTTTGSESGGTITAVRESTPYAPPPWPP